MAFLFKNLNKYRSLTFLVNLNIIHGTLRPYVLFDLESKGAGDIASLHCFWGVGFPGADPGAVPIPVAILPGTVSTRPGSAQPRPPINRLQHTAARRIRCIM